MTLEELLARPEVEGVFGAEWSDGYEVKAWINRRQRIFISHQPTLAEAIAGVLRQLDAHADVVRQLEGRKPCGCTPDVQCAEHHAENPREPGQP